MNEPVVTMESILEPVAQPVWVVDHDGNAADDGGLTVEVGDDGVGGAQAAGCAAWATASAPSTGRSRSRARPAAGRCCARASR